MKTALTMLLLAVSTISSLFLLSRAADNPHGALKAECTACHTTESWNRLRDDMAFDHAETGFRLDGSHRAVKCGNCHRDLVFSHIGTACADCHSDHHLGQLGSVCGDCHTPADWRPREDLLSQHAERGFPLTGVHAVADCQACHRGADRNEYVGTPTECLGCHAEDLARAVDPDHRQPAFAGDCRQCHHAAFGSWTRTTYEHPGSFPLTGAHRPLDCARCHPTSFAGTPNTCFGCHDVDYDATSDPDHLAGGFGTLCETCHSVVAWTPANYDHNLTGFPLTGAHASANCVACHASGYAGTPTECVACHQTDYDNTTDPDHVTATFPTGCELCHSVVAWTPANYDHNLTGFPLTGAHASANCVACHASGYAGTPTECVACHQTDYDNTTDPDHVAATLPTGCELCHSTSDWTPANYDHNLTGFPLTGAHAGANCVACHASGYAGTPTECVACHQTDYDNTTDPDHVAATFPTGCELCHSTSDWSPANYDHNLTGFPLTGAHASANCVACHASGYAGTPTECVACHQTDYDNTTDPDHVAATLPTGCDLCHSTSDWTPANYDHNLTGFSLTGAHASANCVACHASGYAGTPTECVACHQTDYDNTTDPNHADANFPADCETCHTTNGWRPSTWDHDGQYFPIYSGAHSGRWTDCTECHTVPTDFSAFECILCHEHNQTDMDAKHSQVDGYAYLSSECYRCHPRGTH